MTFRLKTLAAGLLGASALAAVALPAAAGVVTIDSRPFTGIVDTSTLTSAAGYVAAWNTALAANPTAPAGYAHATVADWDGNVNNRSLTGGTGVAGDLAFFDQATFNVSAADVGVWAFQLGVDFGLGGTLIIDNTVIDTKTYDLWWGGGGNYGATTQTLAGSLFLGAGNHTLKAYGFEGCCDGGTGGQYLSPTAGGFQDFTTHVDPVPEPAAWALMILGFGGVGAILRRRRSAVAMVTAG